jgi:DNA-binding CsgD family transcriptional regulator
MISTGKKLDDVDMKILELMSQGYTFKEIAPRVHITMPSVVYRVEEMKKYYGCKNSPHLIAYAIDNGIL